MKSLKKAILNGFFIWVITLAAAMILYSIRNNDRIFFEAIIPVILMINVVTFTVDYFSKVTMNFAKEGWRLGIIFFFMNILLDCLVFMWGPMKMGFIDYIKDIGITYLCIPVVTIGLGSALQENKTSTITKTVNS